ncbi:MAG: HEAT repeat domain-containing protein [Pseudomonadota bacterium]
MQTISQKVINRLLSYLEKGDEIDRCYAAKTLGNLRVKEATTALMDRLRDEDIDVCIDAIGALGKISEPDTLPILIESLDKDPDGDVKLAVTESLAFFQNKATIEVLLKLAADRPEGMEFDDHDDWDNWWDLQEKAIVILGEMQVQKAFSVLKVVLEDEFSQDIEAIILKAMAKIGGEADEYLIARLNGTSSSGQKYSEREQRRAATALGFSQNKETLQALGRALTSKSAETRENVIYALGQRKASQYVKVIVMTLGSAHNNVKKAALDVLQILASEAEINQQIDFNQLASLLAEEEKIIQTAVLSFFQQQHKIFPIYDRLNSESQQHIRDCLDSTNDEVIIQAAQLIGLASDTQSIKQLMKLSMAKTHSAWLRQEAILALGQLINLINADEKNPIYNKTTAIKNLKQLIEDKEQAVRAASIQALLNLSNQSAVFSSFINDSENQQDDLLSPINILLATLKGEQLELLEDNTETATPDSDCNSCEKSQDCSAATSAPNEQVLDQITKSFEENNITDNSRLIPGQEEQPLQATMSTLQAIAMNNVDSTLVHVPETEAQKNHDPETGPFISEELAEDMDEYIGIMRKNYDNRKKIVRRKIINPFDDARHICARLLADSAHSQYDKVVVQALLKCLNDNDEQLRLEAIQSLSQISLKNPLIAGLDNSFGKIVTLLDSKDRDMRIACLRAMSHSGNRAAIVQLLDYLSDEDYLVRLEAIQGLVYLLKNKAGLTAEQIAEFMVLDEVKNETVISALFDCLDDQHYSVSMAAIEALIELQQTDAIEQFIDVALQGEGQSARKISKLLKTLDDKKSTELLLQRLDNVPDSSYRRYVMEMLEVVVKPEEITA